MWIWITIAKLLYATYIIQTIEPFDIIALDHTHCSTNIKRIFSIKMHNAHCFELSLALFSHIAFRIQCVYICSVTDLVHLIVPINICISQSCVLLSQYIFLRSYLVFSHICKVLLIDRRLGRDEVRWYTNATTGLLAHMGQCGKDTYIQRQIYVNLENHLCKCSMEYCTPEPYVRHRACKWLQINDIYYYNKVCIHGAFCIGWFCLDHCSKVNSRRSGICCVTLTP